MNPIVAVLHDRADKAIAGALARNGATPPCKKGCFFCCRESVYACSSEVEAMLEMLSQEQLEALKGKTRQWLEKFKQSGIANEREPAALKYRPLLLWCPLLNEQKECSVYERRPLACRAHIAYQSSDGCEHDNLREHQKFALFPGLLEALNVQRIDAMQDGETEVMDHLGILLADALLGKNERTAARVSMHVTNETLTIEKYEHPHDGNPA